MINNKYSQIYFVKIIFIFNYKYKKYNIINL